MEVARLALKLSPNKDEARRLIREVASSDEERRAYIEGVVQQVVTAKSDVDSAKQMAACVTRNQREAETYLRELWARTEEFELVNDPINWCAIEALTSALVEHRRLDYEQASVIIKAVELTGLS